MIFWNKFNCKNVGVAAILNCLFILLSIFLSGCFVANEVEVKTKKISKAKSKESFLPVSVSNVEVVNHQVIITGNNLESISNFIIKDGAATSTLQIESKTSNKIIANTMSHVTFAAGKILDFILSNAEAASTFTVNFSLCDSSLGGKAFSCSSIPNDKEVLSYDAASGKWKPRAINGLSYQGAWDADDPLPTTTTSGDYFIVSDANGAYGVGDWIVFNGTGFDHIVNSTTITNVFGRTGVISANEGDYNLNQLADVDLTTTPPLTGDFLRFDGTSWVPAVIPGGNPGTVTSVSVSAPLGVTNGTSTPALTISQATNSTNGYLSSTDWNTFNNKQPAITAGTTAQYYRGDKTWQTLDSSVVTENINLYFTNARVLGVPLAGFTASNSVIVATDTVLEALGKAQGQISNLTSGGTNYLVKNGTDSISGQVTVGTIGSLLLTYAPVNATDATNKSYVDGKVSKTGDTMSGDLTLDTQAKFKSGSFYTTVIGSSSAGADYTLTLPTGAGSNNQVLTTNGSGVLSWTSPATSATPSGAAGGELAGTFPNPTIKSGVITDSHIATTLSQSKVTNLTTDLANKQSTTLANGNILVGNGSNVATAVSVSGDATLSNAGVLTLANTAVTAGTYNSVTVDGKGRVTGGTAGTVVSSLTVNTPLSNSGTATLPIIDLPAATTSVGGYLTSADWNTFNSKQAAIDKTTVQDVSKLRIYGSNTTNYVELSAATLTGNRSLIFPDSNGASGNVLATDGAGNLSWASLATASPVTSVNSLTGAVSLTTTNVAEGTNLYYTNVRGLGTTITAPTLTNSAVATGDTLQVVVGKLQGQFNSILNLALTGLSTATSSAITVADTIISGFGKLQAQIDTLIAVDSNKLSKNTNDSITATITVSGAGDIVVPTTPALITSAVNKSYVDTQVASASNQWTVGSGNVYRASGNVGVGTNTPAAKLDIQGNLTGTTGTVSNLSTWFDANPSGATTANYMNYLGGGTAGANAQNFTAAIFGTYTEIYHSGTGTVTTMMGANVDALKDGTGPVTTAVSVRAHVGNKNATGTMTNAYGVMVPTFNRTGPITNSWGVYVEDAIASNFFAGNVGIGTTTPSTQLHLRDNAPVMLTVERTTSNNSLIEFKNTIGSMFAGLISGSNDFGIGTTNDLSTSSKLTISSTGHVGVGTNSPGTSIGWVADPNMRVFEVTGSGVANQYSDGILSVTNNRAVPTVNDQIGAILFASKNNLGGVGSAIAAHLTGSGGANGFGTNLNFFTKPDNSATAPLRMIIDSAGNVGVGTQTPTSKLEVAGQIAGKAYKTRLFEAGGKTSGSCTLSSANTSNLTAQFCDLSVTFTLTDAASVQIAYTIAMGHGVAAGAHHLVTGIEIDGSIVSTNITGATDSTSFPFWGVSQTHFANLAVGAHTIKIKYRSPAGGTSYPGLNDWENRILQVMIMGYQ